MPSPSHRKLVPLCDRVGRARLDRIVHHFYGRLRRDPVLAPHFAAIGDFAEHEARIAEFWWVAMGGRVAAPAPVDMVGRHQPLGLTAGDFRRWLALFAETVDAELPQPLAGQWQQMARAIAARLQAQVAGHPV